MITDDTKIVTIKESKGWVTNIDESDLSEDYFSRVRGGRHSTSSLIFQRDNGTKHRYAAATYPVSNLSPTTVTLFDSYTIQDPIDNVEYEIIVGLDNAGSMHVWAYDGSAFTEITRIFTADITGSVTDAAGAVIGLTTIKENGVSAALPTGSFPANMEGWVVVNTTPVGSALAGSSGIVTSSGSNDASHVVLAGINPGASGMKWAAGDHLTLYRTGGLYNATFGGTQGSTPHIAWSPNDTQRKVTLLYGNSATPTVAQIPLIIMRRPQRQYFQTGVTPGTPQLSLPTSPATSWFVESGGGLCSYEAIFGSKTVVKLHGDGQFNTAAATAPDTTNYPANAWLNIGVRNDTVDGGTPNFSYAFLYVTVGYDNYEESDPVLKFFSGSVGTGGHLDLRLDFLINPALMPKNVTQLRVYRYSVDLANGLTAAAIQAFLGAIGDDQLLLQKTINLQSFMWPGYSNTMTAAPTDTMGRWASFAYDSLSTTANAPESSDSIESNLVHAVIDNRKIIRPRFAARATKSTGAVVVMDSDDSTLLVSSYNGAGTNEDDNFPADTVDSNGGVLTVFLMSEGELLGIGINDDKIVALKRNSVELSDFQASQNQHMVQADVLAKRSIVQTPYGLVWCGLNAIYILPADGSPVQIMNKEWKNWYDGTLLTSNATPTPFLTLAQKQAIFAGYDPTYSAYWCVMTCATDDGTTTEQLIARFYFEAIDIEGNLAARWDIRQLGGVTASWLSRRKDTLTIGASSAIMFYPNQLGAGNYKDGVAFDDTGGIGIPTKFRIIFGSLYALSLQNAPTALKFDISTLGTGSFRYRVYVNDRALAIDDRGYQIAQSPHVVQLSPMGAVRTLKMEVELTTDVAAISKFELNTLELHYVPRPNTMPGQR